MSFVSRFRRIAEASACCIGLVVIVAGCNRLLPTSNGMRPTRFSFVMNWKRAGAPRPQTSERQPRKRRLAGRRSKGSLPLRIALPVAADGQRQRDVHPGGKQVLGEELVVDANGGIKDVVLFVSQKISADEPWTHPSAKPGKIEPVLFDQKACVFLSHVVQASQPLQVKNSDAVGHNASMNPKNNSGYNQLIPGGETVVYTAKKISRFRSHARFIPG